MEKVFNANKIKFNHKKIKRNPIQKVIFSIAFILIGIHCLSLLYPFLWLFFASLKGDYEFLTENTFALPQKWLFSNYIESFRFLKVRDTGYIGMLWNSIWNTFGNTAIGVFMTCVVSYCLTKYKFGARTFMVNVIIMIMIFPAFGSGAAVYKQAIDLGIIDTPLILIKSAGGYGGFGYLVMSAYFAGISWAYAESAFIDGAGHFTVFIKIMLPLAVGPIVSLSIITAIGCWNDYMGPLIYLYSYPTLSTGLYIYQADMTRAIRYPVYFAGVLVSMLPVIAIFLIFQETIMNSITTGGLKG